VLFRSVTAAQLGLLTTPTTMAASVHWPDKTTVVLSPVLDAVGTYHADTTVPFPMVSDVGTIRWQATGPGALRERQFFVDPLDY
jgi:hypothetical protein